VVYIKHNDSVRIAFTPKERLSTIGALLLPSSIFVLLAVVEPVRLLWVNLFCAFFAGMCETYYLVREEAFTFTFEYDRNCVKKIFRSGRVIEAKWRDLREVKGARLVFADGTVFYFSLFGDMLPVRDWETMATGVRQICAKKGRRYFAPQDEASGDVPVVDTYTKGGKSSVQPQDQE